MISHQSPFRGTVPQSRVKTFSPRKDSMTWSEQKACSPVLGQPEEASWRKREERTLQVWEVWGQGWGQDIKEVRAKEPGLSATRSPEGCPAGDFLWNRCFEKMRDKNSLRERDSPSGRDIPSPSCASYSSFEEKTASISCVIRNDIGQTDLWKLNTACFSQASTWLENKSKVTADKSQNCCGFSDLIWVISPHSYRRWPRFPLLIHPVSVSQSVSLWVSQCQSIRRSLPVIVRQPVTASQSVSLN